MTAIQPLQILIVDDDDGHCELVRRHLRRTNIANEIHAVHSGQAALAFVAERVTAERHGPAQPLLVLLDIKMPGEFDGLEVLRRLKQDPSTRRIPVIMLTTTDDPREVTRCYDLGCSIYIRKPIEASAFMQAIQRVGLFLAIVTIAAPERCDA